MRPLFISLLLLSSACTYAQLTIVPIARGTVSKSSRPAARTQSLSAMPLPFWDDFSFSNSPYFPHDTLWEYGQSVWLNNGSGINPPSLGVATFDGIDSIGRPYEVNNFLAKGIADRLISRQLRLDLVPAAQQNTVYLSFFYQFKGNGEPPDPGDQLVVQFLNDQNIWETVYTIENDGTLDPTIFYQLIIPVSGAQFFHNAFRFQIHSFGRLSGPYDTWNVDYVYLNKGRSVDDTSYPDRTITSSMSSMFVDYWSIPRQHFFTQPGALFSKPGIDIYNLRVGNTQPLNYFSYATISTHKGGNTNQVKILLDSAEFIGGLTGLDRMSFQVATIPPLSNFDPMADSIEVSFKLGLSTKDNVEPPQQGDYDYAKYNPIDFRLNDTTRATFHLADYYAYDDGTAEYGAALNQPGARLAYLFQMKTSEPDTIVAIDFYFPNFGDESSQSIEIQILSDLIDSESALLYHESAVIVRKDHDQFWRYVPSRFVGVKDKFYIGWKQSSAAVIAVGLDKNTNSGDRIFFNVAGGWEPNTTVTGSLMMRPVFGKGDGKFTAILPEKEPELLCYPNPSNGQFYVSNHPSSIRLFDVSGREHALVIEPESDRALVTMSQHVPGLYLLRMISDGKPVTRKVLVQ